MLRTSVLNKHLARVYAHVWCWHGGFGCWALALAVLGVGRWRGGFGCWALGGVSAVVGVVVGLKTVWEGAQSISLVLSIPSPVTRADATLRYI